MYTSSLVHPFNYAPLCPPPHWIPVDLFFHCGVGSGQSIRIIFLSVLLGITFWTTQNKWKDVMKCICVSGFSNYSLSSVIKQYLIVNELCIILCRGGDWILNLLHCFIKKFKDKRTSSWRCCTRLFRHLPASNWCNFELRREGRNLFVWRVLYREGSLYKKPSKSRLYCIIANIIGII